MNAITILKYLVERFCSDPHNIPRTANVKLCYNDYLDSGFVWGDIIDLVDNPEPCPHTAESTQAPGESESPGASCK